METYFKLAYASLWMSWISEMGPMVALNAKTCNKQWEVKGVSPSTLKQDVISLLDVGLLKLSISS